MSQELCSSQDEGDSYIVKKADVIKSRAETVDYQMEHARLIFDEGLSFSGFERNKVFIHKTFKSSKENLDKLTPSVIF